MVMQVVTPENFQQFVETGKVDEFKAPEATKKEEPKPDASEPKKEEPARGEDGKFIKTDEGVDKGEPKDDKSAAASLDKGDDDDDEGLSEKVRKKIGVKHRAMREAEEFAEQQYNERKAAERRAERLEQELAQAKQTKSRPDPDAEAKAAPKPEDFKTVAEYADALTDFLLEKKLAEREAANAQKRQQEDTARVKAEFSQRIAKAMKEVPDYEEVVSAADVEMPPHMSQYIVESDNGVMLGYHLAKMHQDNPQELDRIRKLSPIRAIAELGKLEVRLEKKVEPKAELKAEVAAVSPQISKAPAPIQPLDGKSTTVEKDPAKMNFQELREWDRQQRAAKRNR